MAYWLVKSEPGTYAWDDLLKDGRTWWDGVRNFQARNNMQAMRTGDEVLFYHSVNEKAVRGIAKVVKEAYPDHTFKAKEGKKNPWEMVDIAPVKTLKKPVTLADIKKEKALQEMALVRQGRLSVMPVTPEEWQVILKLAGA